MKIRIIGLLFVFALLGVLGGGMVLSGLAPDAAAFAASGEMVSTQQSEAIIIDHNCTDLSQIPDYWLEQAKELAIHYAHTSHGSQINSGVEALEGMDPKYDFSIFYAGGSPPDFLDCDEGALCMYDGNPPETYITPEDYWETEDGRNRTRAVGDTYLFDYSMWSWCGQASYYSEAQIQAYLDTMAQFEAEYPGVRYILMTGHTDGGSTQLETNNGLIRQYALDHDMILFDFADIESYDPDGNYYPDTDDSCPWCDDWCTAHPEDCAHVPGSCAHSHPFNCFRKGQAFWWMMARLAGWEGPGGSSGTSQKVASTDTAALGEIISYTIEIRDLAAPLTATVYLTDEVPAGLSYISGTLAATSGTTDDSAAPVLRWSGVLTPAPVVTVTYGVTVNTPVPQVITNTADIVAPGYQALSRTAAVTITLPPGWPVLEPSSKAVSAPGADYGERVTYTVVISNATGPLTRTVLFTDVVPEGLLYVSGTMTATTGTISDTTAPTLTWSGVLTPAPVATITYAALVSETLPRLVVNRADIVLPGYQSLTRSASLIVNGYRAYLPIVILEILP